MPESQVALSKPPTSSEPTGAVSVALAALGTGEVGHYVPGAQHGDIDRDRKGKAVCDGWDGGIYEDRAPRRGPGLGESLSFQIRGQQG